MPFYLDVGEVAHIEQMTKLMPPAGTLGLITKYSMEILQQVRTDEKAPLGISSCICVRDIKCSIRSRQAGSELRPAPAGSVHLKRAAFSRRKLGVATGCAEQPVLVADESGRGGAVAFPHPFGLVANASTSWNIELHAIRANGLIARTQALQCACMRADVGSRHC
eukprot:6992521-Prymnesium_polylepis.1